MRFLLKITFPVENANRASKDGTFEKKLQRIMAGLRPEAVYFAAENGKRTGFLIVNMQETSQMPAIAEPFVPSTWITNKSSRRTRTHHDELNATGMPPSSSKWA